MNTDNLSRIKLAVTPKNQKYISGSEGVFSPADNMVYIKIRTVHNRIQFLAFNTEEEKRNFLGKNSHVAIYDSATDCERQEVADVAGSDFELWVGGEGDCFVCTEPIHPITLLVRDSF